MKNVYKFLIILLFIFICVQCDDKSDNTTQNSDISNKNVDNGSDNDKQNELLYPIFDGNDWGYVNSNGVVIVKPKYLKAMFFHDGMAVVINHDKLYGYIDIKGNEVIKPQFQLANSFSDGLAAVGEDGKWGFIDKSGNMVIEPQYRKVRFFSHGLAPIVIDGKWGFINKDGETIIEPKFPKYSSLTGGTLIETMLLGFYDYFNEGLIPVLYEDSWIYIDKKGNIAIDKGFTQAGHFSEGLAAVRVDEKWGYINPQGNMVIEPQFDMANFFSEGLASVKIDSKWNFIDKTGNIKIKDLPYSSIHEKFIPQLFFSNGLAFVKHNNRYGYIDKKGELIIPAKFELAGPFYNGYALVKGKVKTTIIDINGKYAWEKIELNSD